MSQDCIFCKIAQKEIPSQIVYEDEQVLVFHDIQPAAPVHVLAIPKSHIDHLLAIEESDAPLLAHMMQVIAKVAASLGLEEKGFRVVSNIKQDGGQTVGHLHWHILGGRAMQWPPG